MPESLSGSLSQVVGVVVVAARFKQSSSRVAFFQGMGPSREKILQFRFIKERSRYLSVF